ncbi:expressed protein [Batrachochytrium dendrobatidis JAM81]|uniref:Expressed protein n=1 Tax=Batrachochytrium dendrobatidis (strain JAM81 / FGSC 10211) TaxID=684364 RepID=F4PCQ5_BATDJ|nr:uncharacterized protein BATDEDRAFT_92151 [Batrachochytrium dendrobatidis JAM81]EGF76988.1 expressed protein [Batrachochytrium dendrobatidis JAM81]|eukprot:XP_006682533.1 expressed protein [Batrachochytrium dendrobatidis JAM81]
MDTVDIIEMVVTSIFQYLYYICLGFCMLSWFAMVFFLTSGPIITYVQLLEASVLDLFMAVPSTGYMCSTME